MARELSIGTFNCFGMAQAAVDAITRGPAPYGARLRDDELKRTLDGPHLVCIQEVLSREAESFFDKLGEHRVRDPNTSTWLPVTFRGSGLGIATRMELQASHHESFRSPSVGWDRLARKGTLHVRVKFHDLEIDVLNVHLQSGYEPAPTATRAGQLAELARRVEQIRSPERPFIVCGDFNVCGLKGEHPQYELLRRSLDSFDDLGAHEDLPTFHPEVEHNALAHEVEPGGLKQRIDYVFLRNASNNVPKLTPTRLFRIFDSPLGATQPPASTRNKQPLASAYASDHFGLIATFDVE